MRQIAPLGSYHHADRIVVCELALHGPFHMTPDWLYFRRDTPDRTYNASPKLRARCEIMDPRRANRLLHPTARLVAEYFLGLRRRPSSVRHSPSPDRRECYRDLTQWMLDRASSKVLPRPLVEIRDHPSGTSSRAVSVRAVVAGQQERLP